MIDMVVKRKGTLSELMGLQRGLRCPQCGASAEWSVWETRQLVNSIRRRRYCRMCGTVAVTEERVVGKAAYQPPLEGKGSTGR